MQREQGTVPNKAVEAAESINFDKERMDFLQGRYHLVFGSTYIDGRWVVQIETEGHTVHGSNLREAIDAAMRTIWPR